MVRADHLFIVYLGLLPSLNRVIILWHQLAYEVLRDEKKRLIYDEQGEAGLRGSRLEWTRRTWSKVRQRAGAAVKKIWSFGFKFFNIQFDFEFPAK